MERFLFFYVTFANRNCFQSSSMLDAGDLELYNKKCLE